MEVLACFKCGFGWPLFFYVDFDAPGSMESNAANQGKYPTDVSFLNLSPLQISFSRKSQYMPVTRAVAAVHRC
jgi:hypothetical protein